MTTSRGKTTPDEEAAEIHQIKTWVLRLAENLNQLAEKINAIEERLDGIEAKLSTRH